VPPPGPANGAREEKTEREKARITAGDGVSLGEERAVRCAPTASCLDAATGRRNAFALPDGFIYVTRGILAQFESEAELVGVLGR
jgi:predicted Zn-dependent protease